MNSHQLLPAPSRVLRVMDVPAMLTYFAKLLSDLTRLCCVTRVADYRALKAFLQDYSATGPGPVAR